MVRRTRTLRSKVRRPMLLLGFLDKKIINQKTDADIGFKKVQEYEVEEITKIFSLEPFNIIQKTEMGSIILNFKPELAKERLNKVIKEMF